MVLVIGALAAGYPAMKDGVKAPGTALDCVGMTPGTVVPASGPFLFGPGPQPSGDPDLAAIHYMFGNEFLGPGDDFVSKLVPRDTLDPPLKNGEDVSFDPSGDDLRVTRSC
ncbi:MAG: hypothetical protein JWM90_2121 [Thermoleophilia bacterium]|nr:hypothetical protein [Thermoleophilia bacterium]